MIDVKRLCLAVIVLAFPIAIRPQAPIAAELQEKPTEESVDPPAEGSREFDARARPFDPNLADEIVNRNDSEGQSIEIGSTAPEAARTDEPGVRLEWFSLRGGAGLYGGGGTASFFRIGGELLYWEIARGSAGCCLSGMWREVGTAVGLSQQLNVDEGSGPRELHYGIGLMFGQVVSFFGSQCPGDAVSAFFLGIMVVPEIVLYQYLDSAVAFQVGLELHIATVPIGYFDECCGYPFPNVHPFIGLAF
jgi:hypothetical protein